ncbi:hypothetical protein ACFU1Q_11505 [Brachybacterium paraconglomeratum]
MAEKKNKPVTLVRGNRTITLSLPREIVQYKAAGWAEESAAARRAPVADSPQDAAESTKAQAAGKDGAKK